MSAYRSAHKQIQTGQWHFFAEPPRFDEALQAFQEATRINPDDGEAHLWLAHTLSALGNDTQALPEYKAAMQLAPDDSRAPISLGNSLANLGHYSQAISAYEAGLALKPSYGEMAARMMLADALKHNGQLPDAIHQWTIVAASRAVWSYEDGVPEEAARLIEEHGSSNTRPTKRRR